MKKFLQPSIVALLLAVNILNLDIGIAIAQKASEALIDEDSLNTVDGLRWGAEGWSFSKVTEVRDTLAGTVVGRVVIDRHGVDHSNTGGFSGLFKSPFSAPAPGKILFVSLWGSKIEGCYAELIIQAATTSGRDSEAITQAIVPEKMEIGINGQVVELDAQPKSSGKRFSQNYTYTTYANNTQLQHPGTWYMTRNLFVIDSQIASILSNAPREQVKVRVTLANNETEIFPIGEKTVARWKDVYSFNPSCRTSSKTKSEVKPSDFFWSTFSWRLAPGAALTASKTK